MVKPLYNTVYIFRVIGKRENNSSRLCFVVKRSRIRMLNKNCVVDEICELYKCHNTEICNVGNTALYGRKYVLYGGHETVLYY